MSHEAMMELKMEDTPPPPFVSRPSNQLALLALRDYDTIGLQNIFLFRDFRDCMSLCCVYLRAPGVSISMYKYVC